MEKQFKPFQAVVPDDFKEQMIQFWMNDELCDRETVIAAYDDESFQTLWLRIEGEKCSFIPDLGYSDPGVNGTLCFEEFDNNVPIPVYMLKDV